MTDPTPAEAPPVAPAAPPGWADVGVVLAVVLLPAVHSGFTHALWPQVISRRPPISYFESAALAMLAGWVALVLYLIRAGGQPPARFGLVRPAWIDLPWATALFLLNWWAGGLTAGLSDFDRELYPPPPATAGQFAWVVVGCLAVGFSEELVWRGYLLTRVEALTNSTWQAILFTAALFGLAHLYQGAGGLAGAGLHGLFSGAVFAVTRRLWPVALEHAGYDLLAMTWDC